MKKIFIHYIYVFLLLLISLKIHSQELTLEVSSKKDSENIILRKIDFKKKHKDSISIYNEINNISITLKKNGFFTSTIDSIQKNRKIFKAYYSLNEKITKAIISIDNKDLEIVSNIQVRKGLVSLRSNQIEEFLKKTTKNLDSKGKSFSKVSLKNITIRNKVLFAKLEVFNSEPRTIDKIIIKGYKNFPKSFIKNYYKLKKGLVFNKLKLREISKLSKNLSFIKEIKPPETLFTKDSTHIYMYVEKLKNSSFDGIVNFASKEDGSILFNGTIDLKLSNILDSGESIQLFWNSIGEERQEFKINIEKPYVFNSKISPEISFSIYKQDSTFLNTKFNSKLFYNINPRIKLALTYDSESSENLKENLNNNIKTFNNYFFGFGFKYYIPESNFFLNDKFLLEINPTFGNRSSGLSTTSQFKIETTTSYTWNLNFKNSIYLKNKIGYLKSDSYLDNELFRIGGANNLRGFNEQSIFTNNYTFFNLEYRLLTSNKSYLYTITDYASININNQKENLLGLGIGYLFQINDSKINIGIANGIDFKNKTNFNNSKLILNWVSFF